MCNSFKEESSWREKLSSFKLGEKILFHKNKLPALEGKKIPEESYEVLRSWGHTDVGDPNSSSKAEEVKPHIALHRREATSL